MSNLGARGGTIITQAPIRRVRIDNVVQRRQIVLDAAMTVARSKGILGINWPDVARACEVTTSIITARRCYQNLIELRKAVAERALSAGDTDLIEQAKKFGFLVE